MAEKDAKNQEASDGTLPPAEALRLDELLAYVPGSVVSRTLIKRPVGTVSLFSFDKGQGLSEHTAPFDALVQVLDGQAELTIGGDLVKAGELRGYSIGGRARRVEADLPVAALV